MSERCSITLLGRTELSLSGVQYTSNAAAPPTIRSFHQAEPLVFAQANAAINTHTATAHGARPLNRTAPRACS